MLVSPGSTPSFPYSAYNSPLASQILTRFSLFSFHSPFPLPAYQHWWWMAPPLVHMHVHWWPCHMHCGSGTSTVTVALPLVDSYSLILSFLPLTPASQIQLPPNPPLSQMRSAFPHPYHELLEWFLQLPQGS